MGVWTTANAINGSGQIVGFYENDIIGVAAVGHGFLYSGGTYVTLDDPSASLQGALEGTLATGINDLGQIVGYYYVDEGNNTNVYSFLYNGGSYVTVADPSANLGGPGAGTLANGINDAGQIVGYYFDQTQHAHGFVDNDGTYTTLDDPLGAGGTFVEGINNAGQIVGYYMGTDGARGFLYSNGIYATIDDPLGVKGTYIQGINDSGQIAGYYLDTEGLPHGFVADPQVTTATLVLADGTVVTGGTLTTNDPAASDGGIIEITAGDSADVLDGSTGAVTVNAFVQVDDGAGLELLGTIDSDGTIAVGTHSGAGAELIIDGPVTLSGSGTIELQGSNSVITGAGNPTDELINAGNTISGGGTIEDLTLDNQSGGGSSTRLAAC